MFFEYGKKYGFGVDVFSLASYTFLATHDSRYNYKTISELPHYLKVSRLRTRVLR